MNYRKNLWKYGRTAADVMKPLVQYSDVIFGAEPEYKETIKQLNAQIYDWLESTDGMNIPLKRTVRPHTDHRNQGHY